jgi:hypothetical protein
MYLEPMHAGALVTCSGADRNNPTFSTNLKESLEGVDLVQENGLERVDLKLFKDLPNAVVPALAHGPGNQIRRTLISLAGYS